MGRLADSGVTHGSLMEACSLYDSLWFFLFYFALFPLAGLSSAFLMIGRWGTAFLVHVHR